MFNRWKSSIAILEDNIYQHEQVGSRLYSSETAQSGLRLSIPVSHCIQSRLFSYDEENFSQNGIRLSLENPVNLGTQLALKVKLPNQHEAVELKGVVIWKEPNLNTETFSECGVAFENLKKVSNKERIIHFLTDRLCRLALRENYGLRTRLAASLDDLLGCFKLIYREYINRGYCQENQNLIHYHVHSLMPKSKVFILEKDSALAGTASLIIDSPLGIPMEKLFPEEIKHLRGQGRKIAEVSLLALNQQFFGKKTFSLTDFRKLVGTFNLFKSLFDYACANGVTDLLIAVHPKHKDLYQYLTFEAIAKVKSYDVVGGNPALPMHLDIGRSLSGVSNQSSLYQFFIRPTDVTSKPLSWEWTESSVLPFLFQYRDLWNKISSHEREQILNVYPLIQSMINPGNFEAA